MKYLLVALVLSGCNINYSDGSRVGVVNKLSKKGLLCKTWEGEMMLGGLRSQTDKDGNTSQVANVWGFTVTSPRDVEALQAVMESGKTVRVTYHETVLSTPCTTESGYWVEKVEVL